MPIFLQTKISVLLGGCGFILYYIREPFEPYEYNKISKQWMEFKRKNDDNFWVESIYPGYFENELRIVVEPNNILNGGVYKFSIETNELERIIAE